MQDRTDGKSPHVVVESLIVSDGGKGIEVHLSPAQFGISGVVQLPATDAEIAIGLLDRLAAHRLLFGAYEVEYIGECVESAQDLRMMLSETVTQLRPESELRPLVNLLRSHVHSFLDELRSLFQRLQRCFDLDRANLEAGVKLADDQVARVRHYERLGGGELFKNRRLSIMDLQPPAYGFDAAQIVGKLRGRCGTTLGALCAKFGISQVPADLARIIPSMPAEAVEIPLDENLRFAGEPGVADEIVLRIDAARATGQEVIIKLTAPNEAELSARISNGERLTSVEMANAKLALAAFGERRQALESLLGFFLIDGRFRSAWVPMREEAAICLASLINDRGAKHGAGNHTKLDLFPEAERAIGTFIFVRTSELDQPAMTDGCRSIEEYKEKLIALRGDTLMALPMKMRLELAYPAIIRLLVQLKNAGRLQEEWLRPVNWAFGLG